MAHTSDGKITAPVRLEEDVYCVLGLTRPTGIAADVGHACSNVHGQINKWALRKPLQFHDISMPTARANSELLNVAWGQGDDYMGRVGGVDSDYVAASAAKLAGLIRNGGIFHYYAPDGVVTPFRLADFEGYVHVTNYPITGTVPFITDVTAEEYLGGQIELRLTLGVDVQGSGLVSPTRLLRANNRYIGILITRENGDATLNNSYQSGGKDYLLITTAHPVSYYSLSNAGTAPGATDWDGLLSVFRVDDYHISFTTKLPTRSDAVGGQSAFDDFIGKRIEIYPVITTGPYCFQKSGVGGSGTVGLLAPDREHLASTAYSLREPDAEDLGYKAPIVIFSCRILRNGNQVIIDQLSARFTAASGQPLNYSITIRSVDYSVSYYTGAQGGWQPDTTYASITVKSSNVGTLQPSQSISWQQSDGSLASLHNNATKYRVRVHLTYEAAFTTASAGIIRKTHTVDYEQEIY